MPILPFNDLRNPYSVNQPTDNVGGLTGTGRAVIVRFQGTSITTWTGVSPNGSINQTLQLTDQIAGLPYTDWFFIDGNCDVGSQPGDPSYTAFISQNDLLNSDMNLIAASPLMWEVGQNIFYIYRTAADNALNRQTSLVWEIIEVIDEATYASGAGVPQAFGITQATYGTIPIGTITAVPGDAACNGCSSAYVDIFSYTVAGVHQNGLTENITPGFIMSDPMPAVGVITANQLSVANPLMVNTPFYGGQFPVPGGLLNYSGGFYIGTYWGICDAQPACRNPLAWNYDTSTTPYYAEWLLADPGNLSALFFEPFQVDCAYNSYLPEWPPSGSTNFGDESCCIFIDPVPTGCDPLDDDCGCITHPTAANFCPICTSDCDNIPGGTAATCCTFYHKWMWCNGTGVYASYTGPSYINIVGTPAVPSVDPNSPYTNNEFMQYLYDLPGGAGGAFGTSVLDPVFWDGDNTVVPIGTIIQMYNLGDPSSYFCLQYMGVQSDTAANQHPGDGTHWTSSVWSGASAITLDGNGDIFIPEDCENCMVSSGGSGDYEVFEHCGTGTRVNLINTWATDPIDENVQQNITDLDFADAIDTSGFSCFNCTGPLVVGQTLSIKPINSGWQQAECFEYLGTSATPEGPGPVWIEGHGTGTSNYWKVDPTDITQLVDIDDNCDQCDDATPCQQICIDPASIDYIPGPYGANDCDCNSDPVSPSPLYNPGWNTCCTPCDGTCNDPLASNYDPLGTGCCGSGPGVGEPTVTSGNAGCANIVFSGTSADMDEWMTVQGNGQTSLDPFSFGFENMDTVLYGGPIPQGACVGLNGGFNYSFGSKYELYPYTGYLSPPSGNVFATWDEVLTIAMGGASAGCANCPVTGVTANTTLSELGPLVEAWVLAFDPANTAGPANFSTPVTTGLTVCLCDYATYGINYDCCTYNWKCIPQLVPFAQNWPDPDSQSHKAKVISEWSKKYSGNFDFNPSPVNAWNHIEDTGYISPSLEYLNVSLRYSPVGNLGFNKSTVSGNQGWATGKQPKINQPNTIDNWRFATDFMDDFTGSGVGASSNQIANWDRDLSRSYYKVKTNMINVPGSFNNPGSRVITEPIIGGTKETGLYYHILPTGLITIRKGFEAAFPNTSGKEFKTWRLFIESLLADGLPNDLREQNWTMISQWVLEHVQDINTVNPNKEDAAPEFVSTSISYMVQSPDGCLCLMDPNGPFVDQSACETTLITPGSGSGAGSTNCCACIYGCTDPNSYNYNPLATCDDGSCIDCEPLIIRRCTGLTTYYYGYMADFASQANATCANSDALIAGWGWTSYWDTVYVNYIAANNTDPDPLSGDQQLCFQWVDPNDPDFITYESNNAVSSYFAHTDMVLPNPGLILTLTPWDTVSSPDEACENCGDIPGCTDPAALNYNINATVDDGSCEYCVYGCMDGTALVGGFPDINGYDNTAVYDCDTSTTVPTSGSLCPSPCATGYQYNNYNPCATCEDGSCTEEFYHLWRECGTTNDHIIVAPGATWNDVTAQQWFYDQMMSPSPGNAIGLPAGENPMDCYEYIGTIPDPNIYTVLNPLPMMIDWVCCQTNCETCACIYGCTDDGYCNFDPLATCDDGSCCNLTGCLDPAAFNYCPTCCCDGPCDPVILGCMDLDATNYDPTANTPCEECCEYIVPGCVDPGATNYNPAATVDDGSCEFLNQCKREIKEFGANPTKKLDVECDFASDVYKEYRKQRYGLSNYCGSDLPDHLHEKELCDWEDTKRPAYLSSTIKVLDTYCYPIVDGEPNWFDPLRPTWTIDNCGLYSDVDIDMYFSYDTTSMGLAAIQNQRIAIEGWLADMAARGLPFGGQIYHTLVLGERWLDWGTSILTGVWNNSGSCGGFDSGCPGIPVDHGVCNTGSYVDAVTISSMSLTHKFWVAVDWGNNTNREWYAAMPSTVTNGPLTHLGFPPVLTKSQVLCVNFADESSATNGLGTTAQPYHYQPGPAQFGTTQWKHATDGTGTLQDGSDSKITDCWKADYDEWIKQYELHLAKGPTHKAIMVIYPAKPIPSLSGTLSQTAFPLHVLGGVDSGNNDPQDGRYSTGTAPSNDIANLVNIENGNPYWDTTNLVQPVTHTFGYGGLDKYGWQANVKEESFDADKFKDDLEGYWDPESLKCDDSECIVLNVVNQNNVAISDYDIYVDGGFVGQTNEYGILEFTIPNASVKTNHILNLCLCLVTTGNCCQQNIKITIEEECAPECCDDPTGVNCGDYYTPPSSQQFEGCTDPNASNYQTIATIDDGSCEYCDPEMIISETHTNVTLQGADDGTITISITNGTLPYTYAWSNGATTQNLTGIGGGIYTVTVTDANDCDTTLSISVNEPTMIYGCRDDALGLWPNINGLDQNDVNCTWPCSDDNTVNGTPEGFLYFCYDPDADIADECCEAGCTDPSAANYDVSLDWDCNLQDINAGGGPIGGISGWNSCCIYCVYGCTNPSAGNYDPAADCDDGSCIFYFDCLDASWTQDEVTGYGYTLSNMNGNGTYIETTCAGGFCNPPYVMAEFAIYYSQPSNAAIIAANELTMVTSSAGPNNMYFFQGAGFDNPCPSSNLGFGNNITPLVTIGGYTTLNPYGPNAANSCYAQQQINDFPAGYVFPSWADYVYWHGNGTSTSAGPEWNCGGTQIPLTAADDISDANTLHNSINGGSSTPDNPDPNDNWVYFTWHIPQCTGFVDCECEQQFEKVGEHQNLQDCEDAINCCGEQSAIVYGCIDDGDVMNNPLAQDYFNNSSFAGNSNQDWWEGQNESGIQYAQNNNPMSICDKGIQIEDALINGGSGAIGSGVTGMYTGFPAYNFNPLATHDDGSCCYCAGCTDPADSNYDAGNCWDDPSLCEPTGPSVDGCTDPAANNYDPLANLDDATCTYDGCMDATASNHLTFEANGQPWYVCPSNYAYTTAAITQQCASCCEYQSFACVPTPIEAACFTGNNANGTAINFAAPDTTNTGGSIITRTDLSREYQLTQFTNSCQTFSLSLSDNSDVQNINYAWSNATPGSLAEDANNFFFWHAQANQDNCNINTYDWSQIDIENLYNSTGWTSPAGTGSFQIGSGSSTSSVQKPYARPLVIWATTISLNSTNLWTKNLNDGPLRWTDVVTELHDNHGFDGNTYTDVTGMDRHEVHLATYPLDYNIWIGYVWAECRSGTDMCVPAATGTYTSCIDCETNSTCACSCQ